MSRGSAGIALRWLRAFKTPALLVSLVLSALLTAVAVCTPGYHWLAWISFLPLFVVVRWLRPAAAALAGGLWGICLYGFSTIGPALMAEALAPAIDPTVAATSPSASLLALLIVIPAVYVGLAARPARAIGFKLPILALGWTLIEVALRLHNPTGPQDGLLISSQGEGPQLHWLARLLGYVLSAFLVACANASLVGFLSSSRLSFPTCRSLAGSPNAMAWVPSRIVQQIQSWPLRQAQPRGPPIPATLAS